MVPGKYDITIYRGSTWTITVTAKNAADVDIDFATSYVDIPSAGLGDIRMQIRPIWNNDPIPSGEALLELTLANARIALAGSNLNIVLTLDAETTAALEFNTGKYELELVTGDTTSVVDKLLYGDVTVTGEITI